MAILFGTAIARPWGERPACRRTGFSLSCFYPNAPKPARGYPVPFRRTFAAPILGFTHSDVPALWHPCLRWSHTPAQRQG